MTSVPLLNTAESGIESRRDAGKRPALALVQGAAAPVDETSRISRLTKERLPRGDRDVALAWLEQNGDSGSRHTRRHMPELSFLNRRAIWAYDSVQPNEQRDYVSDVLGIDVYA